MTITRSTYRLSKSQSKDKHKDLVQKPERLHSESGMEIFNQAPNPTQILLTNQLE